MVDTYETEIRLRKPEFYVRTATVDDAAELVEYMGMILDDCMSSISDRDEMLLDLRNEQQYLRRLEANPVAVAFVAVHDGEIIGLLTCEGGKRRKIRHTAEIGMSVRVDWRKRGVGFALMQSVETWARDTGEIVKLALNVFEDNIPAIKLYQKAGFIIEGNLKDHINLGDKYNDLILMAKFID